jgi:hypothetical protein
MGSRPDNLQFNRFVSQKTKRPPGTAFRRLAAAQSDQAGLPFTVKYMFPGRGGLFFPIESGFKTFFDETLSNSSHRAFMG